MPKVSVIIPVYNAEKYLGECLDSVAGQTLGDVEVICVDDGSTDGSAAILVAYAAKDPRIKVMTQQNAGPGPARNRGMDVATGECIAFMDPDDKYPDQNVLEFLYGALSASDCMIAGGSLIYFPDDFPGIEELRAKTDPKMAFPHFGVVQFREYQIPYRYTCFLFRRELLQGVRFPPIRAFQDVPFFANAMTKAGKFLALDRKTYAYRQHPSNGTRNISREKHIDRLHGIRMVMDIAVKNGYWLMFDDLRRRFRMNGRKGGIGKLRLFGIIGLRNELIHRFRKLFGLSRPLALTRKGQSGTCYAAMASDAIRAESSSGGAFTILARKILSRGGAVCGAAFDEDFRCRYEIVRDEASLARLRGSKYVRAALPRSFLADLRTTLESGVPVLFSGTPCHVAAVRRMFADFADSLFTVDLICAGCPDQDLFDRYLDENWGRGNVTKYEFRSKARGWRHHHYLLHVVLKDGREIWRERGEDEFMTAMSSGLGVSAGCFNCPFCTMNRPGDITIGDFWKVPEEMDDGKGTSALLLNTPKGVALFDAVRGDFVKVAAYSPSILEQSQARLRSPRNIPPGRETFWRMLNGGATVKDAADKALPSSSPPKITVIVPVYNAEKYLGECLDSVLGQTLRDIEVVCVDDGSTDGSAAILAEYAAKDSRVKTIAQQNAGPGPARNRGMDVATGECIAFMDPDDKYPDEGTLEFLYSALQDSSCAIAGGKAVYFPADFPGVADQARVADAKAAFPHFGVVDFREYQCPYRFWCYIFRRNLLDGIRFPALRTFQDVPFFAMAMAKAGRFLALDRTTYAYRQHLGNGTRNLSDGKKIDRLTGIRMVMDIAVKHRYWRMFDDMRRRIRANGQEFGFTKRRLLSLVGLRNEVIYRFRKVAGFTNRVPNVTGGGLQPESLSKTYSDCLRHLRNDISENTAKGKEKRLRAIVKRLYILFRLDGLMRFMCRRVWKTNPRKIVFSNFWGRGFADNPKYVALELLRRGVDADLVWLAREPGKVAPTLPKGIRAVQYGGTSGLRELATAAVRIDNQVIGTFLTAGFAKKPDQIYIQTWHGSLGLKKIGFDFATGSADQDYRLHIRKLDGAMVDYLISNSSFESELYRRQWMGGGRIMEFGHPRNDILFGGMSDAEKSRVRAALGIPDGAKTFLYAPTFRDDDSSEGYDLDYAGILAAAQERFGGEWRMMVRRHPRMLPEAITLREGMIDASDYPDMQEILSVVDAMVTDYSSCICDFLFTGRPAFIHARDLAKYESDRGFYYPLSETPFPISETPDALCANIRAFDGDTYAAKAKTFIAARGCVEDGHAAERTVDLICERMGR